MNYTIGELINTSVPHVSLNTPLEVIEKLMESQRLESVVVTNEDNEVVGIIEDIELEEIMDSDVLKETHVTNKFKGVSQKFHLYDALKLMTNNNWDVVPVLGDDMKFIGVAYINDVRAELVENLSFRMNGAIIVLRQMKSDYSLSEMIRICENSDCRVLSVGTRVEEDSRAVEIVLKLDKKDISSVVAAFTRYEYEIVATYGDNMYNEDLRDRLDLLMHYINM